MKIGEEAWRQKSACEMQTPDSLETDLLTVYSSSQLVSQPVRWARLVSIIHICVNPGIVS